MNEVEKMYENAGVEPDYDYFTLFDDKVHKIGRTMHLCKKELKHWLENYQKDYVAIKVIRVDKEYPPFTAEKQIELIKLLSKVTLADYFQFFFYEIKEEWVFRLFMITEMSCESAYTYESRNKDFTEAIAGLINTLWQDLTEEERKQIKNILE